MLHQVVDSRTGATARQFHSTEDEASYNESMAAFRAAIPKHVRFVVGPAETCTGIKVRDGSVRTSGQPVNVEDIADESGFPDTGRPGWKVFEEHVFRGRVVENYGYVPPVHAAGQ